MKIPHNQRFDSYSVEWKKVSGDDEKHFSYATITINELWGIGCLTFKKPLKIDVFFGDTDDDDALAVFDFGMDYKIPTTKEKNCLYNYAGGNDDAEPILTVFSTIKFDLMHSFFHYSGDPNYSHTHWALYGNINDRVDADDSFMYDDWEDEQKEKRLSARGEYLKDIENGHEQT